MLCVPGRTQQRCSIAAFAVHGHPYTFSVKPKWWTVIFCFFATHSSTEAYLRTSPPRGHSTVSVPKRCEGFVAIWLCACKELADNCYQLFIYSSRDSRPSASFHCYGALLTTFPRWHFNDGASAKNNTVWPGRDFGGLLKICHLAEFTLAFEPVLAIIIFIAKWLIECAGNLTGP